jgi:hypothetical protein
MKSPKIGQFWGIGIEARAECSSYEMELGLVAQDTPDRSVGPDDDILLLCGSDKLIITFGDFRSSLKLNGVQRIWNDWNVSLDGNTHPSIPKSDQRPCLMSAFADRV